MKGELIGINGRGSFDKRARINSGVGYAISINQIKNFLGHLLAGIDTDHASLGALVQTQTEKGGLGRMTITSILEEADVARRGVEFEDLSKLDIAGVFPSYAEAQVAWRAKAAALRRLGTAPTPGASDPPQPGAGDDWDPAEVERRVAKLEVSKGVISSYVHNAVHEGLGKIGVLVALESEGDVTVLGTLGRQIAMHVAATNPVALDASGVDQATIERESAILRDKNAGKPDHVMQKIVESGLKSYFKEVTLLEQPFVHDPSKTVTQVLKEAESKAGKPVALSAREFALLEYLAHRQGQVVSRTDIWEHLYDQHDETISNVVDVYIGYLRNKVDRGHDVKLIHTRRGQGYVLGVEG